jgi:hypothetical protein
MLFEMSTISCAPSRCTLPLALALRGAARRLFGTLPFSASAFDVNSQRDGWAERLAGGRAKVAFALSAPLRDLLEIRADNALKVAIRIFQERVNFSSEHSPLFLTRPVLTRLRAKFCNALGLGQLRALMNKTGVERGEGLIKSRESALRDGHLGYIGFGAHKSITARIQFAARALYIIGECRAALVQLLYFSGQVFC